MLFVGTIQAPASADPAPVGSDSGYVIVEQDGAGVVSVPDTSLETAKEKEAWLAERDQGLQTSATTLKSNGSKSVSGGYLNVVGSSSLTSGCGVFSCWRKFGSNWGDFSWIGSGNISTIQGSLKWWLSGVNVSFSLPAGAGFSAAGSGIVWEPAALNNAWHEHLDYSAKVQLNATIVNNAYFTAQGDFLKGGTWYHVQGD
ncbi:hypothetical protein ACWD8I_06270 [Micromonospora arida]|uniref:hypothetical protein n=1 Tax=Micromonospora arida TaxID=2203715 RepID=UPI0036A9B476